MRPQALLALSIVILLIVGVRLSLHADALSIWSDEMWSIFHGGKTLAQIVGERDLLWPFGYFVVLHTWMRITGSSNDFVVHSMGVFTALLGAACLLRVGRLWRMPAAGMLAGLALGTLSYSMYFTLEIRGYTLMLLLEAAFVLLYLRWLEHPAALRSLALWLVVVAMLYTHFLLGLIVALTTAHLLFTRPRMLGRWAALTGLAGIAFLPLVPQLWRGFQLAKAAANANAPPDLLTSGLGSLYRAYGGHLDLVLAAVLLCSAAGWFHAVRRIGWATAAWLFGWGVGVPVVAAILRQNIFFFSARYLVFTIPAVVLLIGIGLAALPRPWMGIGIAALAILALSPWQPFDFRPSYADAPPIRDFMREMARDFRPGDRLVVDPLLRSMTDSLEWWYYKSVYLPQGDLRLDEAGDAAERRVWYLYRQGQEDPDVRYSVSGGRVQRAAWGDWYLHVALFEAPPSDLGNPIGPALRFLGADIDRPPEVHTGDVLPVRLWWTTDLPRTADFVVSLELCDDADRIVAGTAGPPVGADEPPSRLAPGQILLDSRELRIPYHLDDGWFTLRLSVANHAGDRPLSPGRDADDDSRVVIDRFHLTSFATW